MRTHLSSILAAGCLTTACLLFSSSATLASPTFAFTAAGENTLNIADFTVATYESSIDTSNIGSATRTGDDFAFPIVGGAVDAETIALESVSIGGMKFSNGTDVLVLTSPIVNTIAAQPIMTFLVAVNGTLQGRYDMFDLKVPDYAKPQNLAKGHNVKAPNIRVTLSADGAAVFNTTFNATFSAGLSIGSLKVKTVLGSKLPG